MNYYPKIAIAMTIKNEATILRQNILYHKLLGVSQFYIFDDNSDDNTGKTVEDLDYVSFQPSVNGDQYNNRSELKIFTDNWKTHHPARQSLNVLWASEHARKEGFQWIISLDADELICLNHQQQNPEDLAVFFNNLSQDIESVLFTNLEVVQRHIYCKNIFKEETLFKNNKFNLSRKVWDPIEREYFIVNGYYGQGRGKSAFNLNIEAKHGTVHKFIGLKNERKLKTHVALDSLLHYFIYDFHDFYRHTKNYVKLKNKRIRGSVIERQKMVWRDFVNDENVSEEQAKKYYLDHIMYSDSEIEKLKRNKIFGFFSINPKLQSVKSVKQLFENYLDN